MHESLSVMYWNCLRLSDENQKLDYIVALQRQYDPDLLFITEMPEETATILEDQSKFLDYESSVRTRRGWEGLAVIAKQQVAVTRVNHVPSLGKIEDADSRYDNRQLVRVDTSLGHIDVAVLATHISHPHHFWSPEYARRRTQEWKRSAEAVHEVQAEGKEFAWVADTNTFLARTVANRLGLNANGVLLDHSGDGNQRTWHHEMFGWMPDVLYLDRAAVSNGLAAGSRLRTLPRVIGGVACPSDHRSILLELQL